MEDRFETQWMEEIAKESDNFVNVTLSHGMIPSNYSASEMKAIFKAGALWCRKYLHEHPELLEKVK